MARFPLDLPIRKGTKLVQLVQVTTNGAVTPLPVGTRARMQIRTSHRSSAVQAELTTENGRLAIDVATARITITLVSALTAAFTFERGVYDLKLIYPDNEEETITHGKVYVLPSVTR